MSTWLSCLKPWMQSHHYEFSNSCHNCGGELLQSVSLEDTCGKCGVYEHENGQFNTTVVTAFYRTSTAKHSPEDYMNWMGNLLAIAEPMVIFVENSELVDRVLKLREHAKNRTVVVPMPFESFSMYEMFGGKAFWQSQLDMDSEQGIHRDWRLYLVWNEKTSWLKDVSAHNPFRTKYFLWIDFGYIRESRFDNDLLMRRDYIVDDKVYVVNVFPFKPCQTEVDSTGKIFFGKLDAKTYDASTTSCPAIRTNSVNVSVDLRGARGLFGGGAIFGTAHAISQYTELFYDAIKTYASLSLFVGKEQYMMASIGVQNESALITIRPHKYPKYVEEFGDPWFAMVPFLQGHSIPALET
jgi:hypothetical protein